MFFSVTWRLENFSYFWQTSRKPIEIFSPEFHVPTEIKSKWRLLITDEIHPDPPERDIPTDVKIIKLYLVRFEDNSFLSLHLHIEAELLKVDGPLLGPRKLGIDGIYFKRGHMCIVFKNFNFNRSIAEILPQDVLIARCKIWSTHMSIVEEGQCAARTYITLENMYFIAVMEGISNFIPGMNRAAPIISASAEKPLFIVDICLSDEGELIINVVGQIFTHLGSCKVLILDTFGRWEECGQDIEWGKRRFACEFPLTLSFNALVNNKQRYLRNDVITLKCEVEFYSGRLRPQRIDEIEYEPVSEKKNEPQKSPPTLSNDVIS